MKKLVLSMKIISFIIFFVSPFCRLEKSVAYEVSPDVVYVNSNGTCNSYQPCYSTILEGYTYCSNEGIVKISADLFLEDLSFDSEKKCTISCGWDDDFSENNSTSTVTGTVTINAGTVELENLVIGNGSDATSKTLSIPSQKSDYPTVLTVESDYETIQSVEINLGDPSGLPYGGEETRLTEKLIQISFADESPDNSVRVTIATPETPNMIMAKRNDSDSAELLPFVVNDDGSVTVKVATEEISILPVVDTSAVETLTRGDSGPLPFFNVIENNKDRLEVQFDFSRVTSYSVYFNGEIIMDRFPCPEDNIITIFVPYSGVYSFEIYQYVRMGSMVDEYVVWRQDVFTSNDVSITSDKMAELANRFAPILAYNDYEAYYPSSLDYLFNQENPSPALDSEILKFALPWDMSLCGNVSYADAPAAMAYWGHKSSWLDIDCRQAYNSEQVNRTGSIDDATIYYSFVESKTNNKVCYLNYHMFYSFDPKMGDYNDSEFAAHVFDRESITIELEKSEDSEYHVNKVIYSGHLESQTMELLNEDGTSSFSWKGGRVYSETGAVFEYKGHPIAAIAKGSHAVYPACGAYKVITLKVFTLEEPVGGAGTKNNLYYSEATWKNVIVPSTLSSRAPKYNLLPLDLQNLTSNLETDNFYLTFSGNWVDVPGPTNAKFPPFTSREKNPDDWAGNAPCWGLSVYPTYVETLMDRLSDYLVSQEEEPFDEIIIYEGNNSNIRFNKNGYFYKGNTHYIVWSDGHYSTNDLYNKFDSMVKISTSSNGTDWETINILEAPYGSSNHVITVDSKGVIHIAYNEGVATGTYGVSSWDMVYASNDGGSWGKTTLTEGSGYSYYSPSKLISTSDGKIHLFYNKNGWWRYNGPLYQISLNGAIWEPETLISDLSFGLGDPDDYENILVDVEEDGNDLVLLVSSGYHHLSYHGEVEYSNRVFKLTSSESGYTSEELEMQTPRFDYKDGSIAYISEDWKSFYIDGTLVDTIEDAKEQYSSVFFDKINQKALFKIMKDGESSSVNYLYEYNQETGTYELAETVDGGGCVLVNDLLFRILRRENPKRFSVCY